MVQSSPPEHTIVVIGLGYVGLPLAVALAREFAVTGIDSDETRVAELQAGHDRTGEVAREILEQSRLKLATDPAQGQGATMYLIAVPTPVDKDNRPDLSAVLSASRAVAAMIDPALRPTVVFESTVYPGVTEDICGQEIERGGDLVRGRDFRLGYSPERINPGDREHSIDKITKVIAGEDSEVVEQLAQVYGAITSGGVFRAASIRTAEAAKVIENAQRDINIAFVNEVAQIFSLAGLSVWDVLAAARTKWNFLAFEPGLVGGHCIGVDPYYLSHLAEQLGQHPRVILAGRETNDGMGEWIVDRLHERRGGKPGSAIVLGLTFKENVPDIRNSRSFDLAKRLDELGYAVAVADPVADPGELRGQKFDVVEPSGKAYDLVIGAVAHRAYRELDGAALQAMVKPGGILADLKGMWRDRRLDDGVERWSL